MRLGVAIDEVLRKFVDEVWRSQGDEVWRAKLHIWCGIDKWVLASKIVGVWRIYCTVRRVWRW